MRNAFQMVLLLFFFVRLFSSCEKEIAYDATGFEKRLAVDAIVENGFAKIFLSQNTSTLSSDTIISLKDAEVYINGIKLLEKGKVDYPFINVKPNSHPGDVLTLSISKNGFPNITAQAIIPHKPSFKILSSKIVKGKSLLWYDEYIEFTIELSENDVNSTDYYIIELINGIYLYDYIYNTTTHAYDRTYNRTYKSHSLFYTNDQIGDICETGLGFDLNKAEFTLEDDRVDPQSFIFSDKTFNGKSKTITFMTQHALVDMYEFRISTINQGYYKFIQSVAAYNFNSGMFNEPIRIKSNINGGFGYFGIKTTVTDSIKISDIN
jgi:hypothetical protein